jgi:hypothetical protein
LVLSGSDVVQSVTVSIDDLTVIHSSGGFNPSELPATVAVTVDPATLAPGGHTFDVSILHGFGWGNFLTEQVAFTVP